MADGAELVGGPLDGHTASLRASALLYVWARECKDRVRVFAAPAPPGRPLRYLYRRESGRFIYAHMTDGVCSGCDTPQPPTEEGTCRLCGDPLIQPRIQV